MSSTFPTIPTTHAYCPGCYKFTLSFGSDYKICSKCRSASLRGNSPTFVYCLDCNKHIDKLLICTLKYKDFPTECIGCFAANKNSSN